MSGWKNLAKQPEGSLPGGLLTKVATMLATVLVLTLILSVGFCGGADEEVASSDGGSTSPVATPGRPVAGQLAAAIQQAERRAEAERRADAAFRRLEADLQNPESAFSGGAVLDTTAGALPDPEATEIRRNIELEELERRFRSLRAGPVAQSFRRSGASPSTGGGERGAPRALQPPGDPASLLRGMQQAPILPEASTGPRGGELDIPLPDSRRLPDYDNPPRVITPNDPPGWERVYEGSFVEAVLVNQLSGEFPGPVLATVSVPFYSADRQRVLVPRGSRLVGTAQAVGRRGQSRLAVGFHRLVFADGRHVPLRFLGLNQLGESGLRDIVDRHYLSTFLAAGAIGILSGFAAVRGNPYAGGSAGALSSAGTGVAGTGTQLLDGFVNRLPTITIRAGHRLRVWFTSDVLIPRPPPP